MLARIPDSLPGAAPTKIRPLPFCSPSVTLLSETQPDATSVTLLRSTSTAALSLISPSVVNFADTASRAGTTAGFAWAAAAFTAGTTLSANCRCLSSLRTTSLSPATGAQALPDATVLVAPPPVPEDPELPHAAVSATAAMRRAMNLIRACMNARLLCPVRPVGRDAGLAGGVPHGSCNPAGGLGAMQFGVLVALPFPAVAQS